LFSGIWSGSAKKGQAGYDGIRLPANREFERELAYLDAMDIQPPDAAGLERVRKALSSTNNFLAAKAARIAIDHNLVSMLAEIRAAFDRFFQDSIQTDPQCSAKIALAKALVKLGCKETSVYLRGLRHFQTEEVWGGQSDTAGELRSTCVQGLILSGELGNAELLSILLDPLLDHDKSVRIAAARAMGQLGGVTAALLLKLRIMVSKEDPEILGACFLSLLSMGHSDKLGSIALVADFLEDGEGAAAEAAFALAETHEPAALQALIRRRRKGPDARLASTLDHAIVLTRLQEGMDFLLELMESDPRQAPSVLEAISRLHNSPRVQARVSASVSKSRSERARSAFRKFFPDSEYEPSGF
jgi:HEAT repeat protein